MTKNRQLKFGLIIPIISAFFVASSFCLQFMPKSAMASDMDNGANMDACHQAAAESHGMAGVNYQATTATSLGDCCFDQNHYANTLNQELDFDRQLADSFVVDSFDPKIESFKLEYKSVFLPPPEADSLRSIVKNE